MERRSFIKGAAAAGVAGAAVASSFPKPAISQGAQEWRMVTSWPKGLPGVGTGAQKLADNIGKMSGGRLTIKVYAAGELVPALQCFDAVSNGTAEMGHDASYYHLSKSEACAFFTAFPWGLTAGELTGWVHHSGGQELWDELYAPFNLKGFLAGNTGTQMFGWFRKEINTVDDIKGLKYRTPGNLAKIMTKLGATVVALPAGEIFQAMQSGALDAAEWVGPYNDLSFGLYQVAQYYYSPGFQEPGAGLQLTVNKAKYDALPDDLKTIIKVAAQSANDNMYGEYCARSGPALATLVNQHKVQIRSLPREVLIAMGNTANEVLLEIMEKDAITRRVAESYLQYRNAVVPWTRVGEQAFLSARQLPFAFGAKG
ncbi:MAG: twin-arginine translocation signal domain-containing protein [Azospirillum sp.]|nr:twin-arginine translocation signal domain-containing protein [Azospirillum sp.]